jgi:hypothetical protein
LIGKKERDSGRYAQVYRSIDHRVLYSTCEDLKKPTVPVKYDRFRPKGGFSDDLKILSDHVVALQESRHAADYDPGFRTTPANATVIIARARAAITLLGGLSRPQLQAFLALVIFPVRR